MVKFRVRPDLEVDMTARDDRGLSTTVIDDMLQFRDKICVFRPTVGGDYRMVDPPGFGQYYWNKAWLLPLPKIDIVSVFRNRFLELE